MLEIIAVLLGITATGILILVLTSIFIGYLSHKDYVDELNEGLDDD